MLALLIAPLVLAAATSGEEYRKPLISLRDMDFVGEDRQLRSALAQRMAALRQPLDFSDLETKMAAGRKPDFTRRPLTEIKPDILPLDLGHQKVNISLEYGEVVSAEDAKPALHNASRRYNEPGLYWRCKKIVEMMYQTVYSVQQLLLEVEPFISEYEHDMRFRITYIFKRLDEWRENMRTLAYPLQHNKLTYLKQVIYYYERMLRLNIDITYSVEYIIFLHTDYMDRMDELIPKDQRDKAKEMQKVKEKNLALEAEKNKNMNAKTPT